MTSNQQQVALTPQVIEQIRQQTKQTWRKCKRKQYNIFACKVPAGYIFANKLEQPESYNAIKQTFHKDFVHTSEFNKVPQLVEFLKQHGFYQTDGTRIVLCGTKGELWDVKPEKLVQSYRTTTGNQITSMKEGEWIEVSRAAEPSASAVGIQLPTNFLGVYQTSWATLYVNNGNSSGHGKGDILVAPMLPNGQPDYANISPTNNEVFALTYDQGVGGWSNSGLITSPQSIERLTLNDVKKMHKFNKSNESIREDLINKAIKLCGGFIDYKMDFDDSGDEDIDCWIFDPRIGRTFNVSYCNNSCIIIAEAEEYEDDSRIQWFTKRVSVNNESAINKIFEDYNNHAKSIAVKFRSYCEKYNLKSLYKLSSSEIRNKTNNKTFVDKSKANYVIKMILALANKRGWSKFKIDDSRIHDEMNDIISGEMKLSLNLDISYNNGYFLISMSDDNAFHYCGWSNSDTIRDPYETNLYDVNELNAAIDTTLKCNY